MKKLYQGKTKDVLANEETGAVYLFFKDDATGENGVFDHVAGLHIQGVHVVVPGLPD